MTRNHTVLVVLGIALIAVSPHAQTPEPKAPTFAVVSIRPHKTLERGGSLKFRPGGRFEGTNVYVLALIAAAFGDGRPLLPAQMEGGPDWIRTDRFDVVAKTDTVVDSEASYYRRLPAMLRPVLEERFRLKAHWETRQIPVYALGLAHTDGSLGSHLRHSTCTPRPETIGVNDTSAGLREGRSACGPSTASTGMIDASGISMSSLVTVLASDVSRVVLDRTGLEGTYDVKLTWTPDGFGQSSDPNIPPLSTALQEQLGLKLESANAPIDVLVIDHVEKPQPD
jgi:uncharacterized protein (TIGR03435 family)